MPINPASTVTLRHDLTTVIDETRQPLNLVSDEILPPIGVDQDSGRIPALPTGTGKKVVDTRMTPDGGFSRSGFGYTDVYFYTEPHGHEIPIKDHERDKVKNYFDAELIASRIADNYLEISREKLVADALFNTTTFSGSNDYQGVAVVWATIASSTVEVDVHNAWLKLKAKTGVAKTACHLAMNEVNLRYCLKAASLTGRLVYTAPIEFMSEQQQAVMLANFLGVAKVVVCKSAADSTAIGALAADFGDIWSSSYSLLYIPSPAIESWEIPGLGRQPWWRTRYGSRKVILSYREQSLRQEVYAAESFTGRYIDNKYGVLITTTVTA